MPINAKIRLKISLIVGSFSPILDQHLHQVELSRRTHKVCALKLTRVCIAFDGFAYILHALFSVANRFFGVALDLLMQSLDLHLFIVDSLACSPLDFADNVFDGAFDLVFAHGELS